jgi:hypothetical protein
VGRQPALDVRRQANVTAFGFLETPRDVDEVLGHAQLVRKAYALSMIAWMWGVRLKREGGWQLLHRTDEQDRRNNLPAYACRPD